MANPDEPPQLVFRVHAIQRMFERGITVDDVESVLRAGEIIESYPLDKPYPSRLMLGWQRDRPIHVVVAGDPPGQQVIVTVYEPDLDRWHSDFRRRRQ